jgi:hypothetical protein
VLDRRADASPIRYCVTVPVFSDRLSKAAAAGGAAGLAAQNNPYGGSDEPFAMLHRG